MSNVNLESIATRYNESAGKFEHSVVVCAGTGCIANGSMDIYNRFIELADQKEYRITVAPQREEGWQRLLQNSCSNGCCHK